MSEANEMQPVSVKYPAQSSEPVLADHAANVTVWANGSGVWHVRVSRTSVAALVAARRALRDELYARENRTTMIEPDIFMHPVRVEELDTDDTIVYRERFVGGENADPSPGQPVLGRTLESKYRRLRSVIGNVSVTGSGNVIVRVGREVEYEGQTGWEQSEHVVLTPAERDTLIELLEATRGE